MAQVRNSVAWGKPLFVAFDVLRGDDACPLQVTSHQMNCDKLWTVLEGIHLKKFKTFSPR